MTNRFFTMLHPTFEALSAYADLSELDAARSHVARHESRCAECREIVAVRLCDSSIALRRLSFSGLASIILRVTGIWS